MDGWMGGMSLQGNYNAANGSCAEWPRHNATLWGSGEEGRTERRRGDGETEGAKGEGIDGEMGRLGEWRRRR